MHPRLRLALLLLCVLLVGGRPDEAAAQAKPEGEMRWALYVTLLAGRGSIPARWSGMLTPFWVLYALHDALVKPMPGNLMAPSLAESWTVSADQKVYEFKLREGLKFHNGDPFTAEDVKFSFHARQGRARSCRRRCGRSRSSSPYRVRFHPARAVAGLHDLLRHLRDRRGLDRAQEVRRAGGRRRLQEAPDRARALQVREPHPRRRAGDGGQRGLLAQDALGEAAGLQERAGGHHAAGHAQARRGRHRLPARRAAGRRRSSAIPTSSSPSPAASAPSTSTSSTSGIRSRRGHDRRVRLAANHAIDRKALSEAETLGASRPDRQHRPAHASSSRCRSSRTPTIRRKAKQLLAEAGYPNGFDAGELHPLPALLLDGRGDRRLLPARSASGSRMRTDGARRLLRALASRRSSRASASASARVYGNAASRLSEVVPERRRVRLRRLSRHRRALQAAGARDRPEEARGACCTRSSSSLHERVRFAPIFDYIWPSGVGPRVAEPALMLIDPYPWSAPLEEVRLKKN